MVAPVVPPLPAGFSLDQSGGEPPPLPPGFQLDQTSQVPRGTSQPAKIGKEGFTDALRETLRNTDWGTRQIAGAGTALSNLWQRGKQFVGQGDEQAIQNNRTIAEEAPVGAIAGNVALLAPTALIPGANTAAGAGLIGAATGALQPTLGDESTLKNAALGGAFGAGGQQAGKLVGQGLQKVFDAKAAALATKQITNAPIDTTLQQGMDAGYVVPPSMANGGFLARTVEGMSGKQKINQLASIRNQEKTDSLARQAVGLAPDAPLTAEAMQGIRQQAYQKGYDPIAKMGEVPADTDYVKTLDSIVGKYTGASKSFGQAIPDDVGKLIDSFRVGKFDAGDALQASQALRDQANSAFARGDKGFAKAAKDVSKALEDQIERHLQTGGPTWTAVDDALSKNLSTGDATMLKNARGIVDQLRQGKLNQAQAIQNLQQFATSGNVSKSATNALNQAASLIPALQKAPTLSPTALKDFRDARVLMAKAHTVEDAIREGGGRVSAAKLAQRLQAGKPLSGELKTIGQFANNFGDVTRLPKAGDANPITALDTMIFGPSALMTGGAALGIPAARVAARYGLLSGPMQRAMGAPNYSQNALMEMLTKGANNETINRMLPALSAQAGSGIDAEKKSRIFDSIAAADNANKEWSDRTANKLASAMGVEGEMNNPQMRTAYEQAMNFLPTGAAVGMVKKVYSAEQMAKWAAEKEARNSAQIIAAENGRKADADFAQKAINRYSSEGMGKSFTPDQLNKISEYRLSGDRAGAIAEGKSQAVDSIKNALEKKGVSIEKISKKDGGNSIYARVGDELIRISDHELPLTPSRQSNRESGYSGVWDREITTNDWQSATLEDYLSEIFRKKH